MRTSRMMLWLVAALLSVSVAGLFVGCEGDDDVAGLIEAITFMTENDSDVTMIGIMEPDGDNKSFFLPVSEPDGVAQGALNPDGDRMVFISLDDVNIRVLDLETGLIDDLYTASGEFATTPNWSPDGDTIIFSAPNDNGDQAIWTIPANGGMASILAEGAPGEDYLLPSYNAAGTRIVFQRQFSEEPSEIMIMDDDGTDIDSLIDTGENIHPSFLPSGRILFVHRDDPDVGQRDIYVMDADGDNLFNLTQTGAISEQFPSSNRAGNRIAYWHDDDIYAASLSGNNLGAETNLTNDRAQIAWRPLYGRIMTDLWPN